MARVLMLVTNDLNPDPRVLREAQTLTRRGYDVRILGLTNSGRTTTRFERNPDGISSAMIGVSQWISGGIETGWIQAFVRILVFFLGCIRHSKAVLDRVSVVHAHDFDTLPIGLMLARMSGAKVLYDAHESYPEMFSDEVPPPVTKLVEILEAKASRCADSIVASGDLLKRRMQVISGKEVRVIRNTVTASFGAGQKKSPGDTFTVGYIGGLIRGRNIEQLVEAFKCFAEMYEDVKLVIAGWGPLSDWIKLEFEKASEKMLFLGRVDYAEVPRILSSLSLSICFGSRSIPNNVYATPNKVFEAASLGVPVLASDFGELKRIVKNWRLGYTVDSESTMAIQSALAEIYLDREELWQLGMSAKETFIRELSWEIVEEELIQIYTKLLSVT